MNGLEEFQASLAQALAELRKLDLRRRELVTEIRSLREKVAAEAFSTAEKSGAYTTAAVTHYSPEAAKIQLFRSLFRGREDVYPKRFESRRTGKSGYQPHCRNEWVGGVCEKPRVKCKDCPNREFIPVTDAVIRNHLLGTEPGRRRDFTMGTYPLLPNDSCWFLAADFDKQSWKADKRELVNLVVELCKQFEDVRAFVQCRFREPPIDWYKKQVQYCVRPDVIERDEFDFERGVALVEQYKSATDDMQGTIDLMLFFVEQGNQFTLDYGDIDSWFYEELEEMFGKAVRILERHPKRSGSLLFTACKHLGDVIFLYSGLCRPRLRIRPDSRPPATLAARQTCP